MMRLALGGKLGKPGRPPVDLAWAWLSRVARAARPVGVEVRKWGRVMSFIGDGLVEVEDQAGYGGVGGEFRGVEGFVSWGVALGQVIFGSFGVGSIALCKFVQGSFEELLFGGFGRAREGEVEGVVDAALVH